MDTTAARPLRLFTALWPGEPLVARMAGWQRNWRWPPRAACIRPERLHATLHFLGDVPAARIPELAQGLQVPFEPFTLEFGAAEVWPNGVAVLLPHEPPAALASLHGRLGDAVRRLGLPTEARPYRPHVTVARRAWDASPAPVPAGLRWRVDGGYLLVRSLPGGAGYEPLARFT
jgi:RNA 2',3'-cyclic 3'-phosphodiesterase